MKHTIAIACLPPTLNEIISAAKSANRGAEYSRLKKEFTQAIQFWTIGCPCFPGKVWVKCHWTIGSDFRDPLDNVVSALKPVLDALVKNRILTDDSAKVIQSPAVHTWEVRRGRPEGVTIVLSDKPFLQITELPDD